LGTGDQLITIIFARSLALSYGRCGSHWY
jgi:hypothetical protein